MPNTFTTFFTRLIAVINLKLTGKHNLLITLMTLFALSSATTIAEARETVIQKVITQKQPSNELDPQEKAWIEGILKQDKANKAAWDAELKANPDAGGMAKYHTTVAQNYIDNHFIAQMIQDGLIGKKRGSITNLSFALTKQGEFYVNNVKQPKKIYQKYLSSLHTPIPGPVNYTYSTSTSHEESRGTVGNMASSSRHYEPEKENVTLSSGEKQILIRDRLLNDLLKDGLIKDTKKVSFTLLEAQFILNGVKLPAKVQQKYSAKYLTGDLSSWQYSQEGDRFDNKKSEAFGHKPVYN